MSSLGLNRRALNSQRVGHASNATNVALKQTRQVKFEIYCDEDATLPPTSKGAIQSATSGRTQQLATNQSTQINPQPPARKLHALKPQPVHCKNSQPLGERTINYYRRQQMTVTNLKKHDAQSLSNEETQDILKTNTNNTIANNSTNPKKCYNVQSSLRTSLSTCSDVSEFGIKTLSVEEAAEILQSRLAERNHQLNKSSASPTSPMSLDGAHSGGASLFRRTSSVMDFKENNDISFCDQENNDDTEIDENDDDYENRYYADEDGFDDSDLSVSDDVQDCSVNFDVSTIFKCEDYAHDIHDYLISLERSSPFRPNPNYMRYQDEIDSSMRCVLVDWMVDVAEEHGLTHETLFQAVSMVDRFLSVMGISTSSFQLLGVAALFTASKYEEVYPPDLYQFVNVTDKTYSAAQILNMEHLILKAIDFRISGPTSYYFLCKIFTFGSFPVQVYHLTEYLCYLTMMEDQPFLEYYPSEIAISACILAIYQLGLKDLITDNMIEAFRKANSDQIERAKTNNEEQTERRARSSATDRKLPLCIEAIHAMQEYAPSHKQQAIYNKFSSMTYDCVSGMKPLSNIQVVVNL